MTAKKQRHRQALRYGQRIQGTPGIVFPPSVTISYAHRLDPKLFPLASRRSWKKRRSGVQYGTRG